MALQILSTKLGTKHPWEKLIQACSNKGQCPFLCGDNNEIVAIHSQNLKTLSSKTTVPISTKLGTKHSWVKGIQVCSKD